MRVDDRRIEVATKRVKDRLNMVAVAVFWVGFWTGSSCLSKVILMAKAV